MGSGVISLGSRDRTWIDAYPLSFLPSLEQLSAARPRVARPAPQDPFQSVPGLSVAKHKVTDAVATRGKRLVACLDADDHPASERVDAAQVSLGLGPQFSCIRSSKPVGRSSAESTSLSQANELETRQVTDTASSSTAPTHPMEGSGYSKRKRKGRKARKRVKARMAANSQATATVELPSSARPPTPLPPPPSLPPALPSRPSLPVFLSSETLFPDLSRLRITHYDAFLLRRPVEPAWSAPMYECILRFLLSRAPAEHWHPDPARLASGDQLPSIAYEIRARQPNQQAIRACFQPRDVPGFDTLTAAMQDKFYAMQAVMRWMWGDATLSVHAVTDLVQRAPLALHILGAIRLLVRVRRVTK